MAIVRLIDRRERRMTRMFYLKDLYRHYTRDRVIDLTIEDRIVQIHKVEMNSAKFPIFVYATTIDQPNHAVRMNVLRQCSRADVEKVFQFACHLQ